MNAFISCSPSDGRVLSTRAAWKPAQFIELIEQTKRAQMAWRKKSVSQRAQLLWNFAEKLEAHREALARLIVLEVGRLPRECLAEIEKSAQLARYYAERAPELLTARTVDQEVANCSVHFEPLGVVFAVMPWNYPVWQVLRFALPALVAGNACIVKPAPSVPQTSQYLWHVLEDAGLGDVAQLAWLDHDTVELGIAQTDAFAFTGSTQTGRYLAALAGRYLKKCVLELGGSNPLIVLEDADLELAAREAAHSRFRDAGQSCNAAKRLILLPKIADEFLAYFLSHCAAFKLGDPFDASTTLAPLARADLRTNLHAQVLDALAHGARLLCGGEIPEGAGFFYPATVLDHISPACRLYHEESFGPVASVMYAHDEADAIRIANDTPFGLGASIFTRRAEILATWGAELNVGSVFVNRYTSSDLRLPFGGVKASGFGRELSEFGLYEFLNIKTYWMRKGG